MQLWALIVAGGVTLAVLVAGWFGPGTEEPQASPAEPETVAERRRPRS